MVIDQIEFMKAGGQTTDGYDVDQVDLYNRLIVEEVSEHTIATLMEPEANELKEMIDIIVVILGKIISMGVNPQDAWDLVHSNNMAKVTGKVVKDTNGKIVKSPEAIAAKAKMMRDLDNLFDKSLCSQGESV